MSVPRSRRPIALGGLTVLVAFLAGLGAGALLFGSDGGNGQTATPPQRGLFEDLHLTADQERQIDSIMGVMRRSTDSLMDEARVDLTARATRARQAIEGVLTPEQAALLDERMRDLGPFIMRRVQINDSLVRVDTIR